MEFVRIIGAILKLNFAWLLRPLSIGAIRHRHSAFLVASLDVNHSQAMSNSPLNSIVYFASTSPQTSRYQGAVYYYATGCAYPYQDRDIAVHDRLNKFDAREALVVRCLGIAR